MHARVIFCRVDGLLETLKVVYILKKGNKSTNAEKNENVELPHTQLFGVDYVCCANKCNQK